MVECEYCGAAFEDEEAHLEHLGEEHAEELGAIDRRRVESATNEENGGLPVVGLLSGVAVLVVLVVAIWFFFLSGGGGVEGVDAEPTGIEDDPLQDSGDEQWISQVETFEDKGREHVARGETNYERIPPLSGDHWGRAVEAGFYTETPELPRLVHTIEHGAVVIYYDEAALNDSAEASLRAWANNKDGTWQSIVVVPNPNDDPRGDYVLTAWTHRLTLDSYNAEAVYAFASEYLGRGPENPVR